MLIPLIFNLSAGGEVPTEPPPPPPPPPGSEPPTVAPVPGYISHQYGDEMYDYTGADADPNDLNYKAFQVKAKTDDGTVYRWIKATNRHWAEGWAQMHKSTNGTTWTPVANINPYGNIVVNSANVMVGVPGVGASGNRVIIAYNVGLTEGAGYKTGSYQWTDYAYSDDGGVSWTYAGRVMSEYGDVGSIDKGIAAYGRMLKLPSGKLMQPIYVWDYVLTQFKVIFHQSTDNGASWSIGSTIITGTSEINETWVEVAEWGATDATTKLISITRAEIIGGIPSWVQRYSNDGGATWQTAGTINGTENTDNTWPVAMYKIQNTLYRIEGVRYGDYTGHRNFYLSIRSMPASQYNTLNWGPARIVTRPICEYKGDKNPQDWGYAELMQLADGKVIASYYDDSTFYRPAVDSYKRHRIITINAFFNYRYEAFNPASQSGTLSFPNKWLDSDLMNLANLPAGSYRVELEVSESATISINGNSGTKQMVQNLTISEGGSITATSVTAVTNARIRVKKIEAGGVQLVAGRSTTQAISGKTQITFPNTTTDSGGFRLSGRDVFPQEGDYEMQISLVTPAAGNVWIEAIDWGETGETARRHVRQFTTSAGGGTTKRALFLDIHINYEIRIYSDTDVSSATLTVTKI